MNDPLPEFEGCLAPQGWEHTASSPFPVGPMIQGRRLRRTQATKEQSVTASTIARTAGHRGSVLIIDLGSALNRALDEELRGCQLSVSYAPSMETAPRVPGAEAGLPTTVLIPESLVCAETFEEELAALRIRTGAPSLVPVALGRRPDEARRNELRAAGIRLALFGRFGRHTLRFQINRALSPFATRSLRGELRGPMEWRTRTFCSGREKGVRCYSLSTRGAYFVTPRPWVVGSELDLELPLGGRERKVHGRVLYTKHNDGLDRPGLPGGMAVAFEPLATGLRDVIKQDLSRSRFGLEV